MALHRIVNGKKVDCSEEEESKIKAEWEANRIAKAERKQKQLDQEQLKLSTIEKIRASIGLDEREISALFR